MVYRRVKFAANDDEDMVNIVIGAIAGRVDYQQSFRLSQSLRLACIGAARHDRAPGTFWRDVDMEDLNDCPPPHRTSRRSKQIATVDHWQTKYNGAEVCVLFDGKGEIMGYEDGIKLHQKIRRAGRRAKAWAGDGSANLVLLAGLTDGEENYKLGLI